MISDKLVAELNEQIKHEFFSANYYLAMAAYSVDQGFEGISHFFVRQAEEERGHAMKFFYFLNELGSRVRITGFDEPKNEFQSIKEVFEKALEHEQFVTKRIHGLYELAEKEKHYPTVSFLNWFVDEQVEEEDTMRGILDKINYINGTGPGMLILDSKLGERK